MTLPTESIDIPLIGGINQAIDKRLVEPGQALDLQNVRSPRAGGWEKRYGTTPLARTKTSGGSVSAAKRLGQFGSKLLLSDGSTLYARTGSTWAPVPGRLSPAGMTETPIGLGVQAEVHNFDWLRTSDGLITVVWECVTQGGSGARVLYHYVVDEDTGAVVYGPQEITGDEPYGPRLLQVGSSVCLVYAGNANEILVASKTTIAGAFGTAGVISAVFTGVSAPLGCEFDACAIPSNTTHFALAFWDNAFGLRVAYVTISGTLVSQITSAGVYGGAAGESVGICANSTRVFVAASTDTGSGVLTAVTISGWAEDTPYGPIGLGTGRRIALLADPTDATRAYVFYSHRVSTTRSTLTTVTVHYSNTGALVGPQSWFTNELTLASKPWFRSESNTEIWAFHAYAPIIDTLSGGTVYKRGLGSAYFARYDISDGFVASPANITAPLGVHGKAIPRLVDFGDDSMLAQYRVPNTLQNDDAWSAPFQRARELSGGVEAPLSAPQRVTADFDDTDVGQMLEFAGVTYIAPCQMYDGERVAESWFLKEPTKTAATLAVGGGALTAGEYQYISCRRWVSANGRVMRMRDIPTDSLTAALNDSGTLAVYTASITELQDQDPALQAPGLRYQLAEMYRTESNGTIYYLADTLPLPKSDTSFTGSISMGTDTSSDTTISANRPLNTSFAYQLGAPSLRSLCSWLNRLCGVGPDKSTIWISSEPADTELPFFNELFNLRVDVDAITALAVLDDKLLVFTERSVFVVIGQPADNTGFGNTMTVQAVSSDVGCIDARSIAVSSVGVWFQAVDGIYLADRSLQVMPIGRAVQDELTSYPVITSAAVIDRDREVRFTLQATEAATQGIVLAYDITEQEWIRRTYLDTVATPDTSSVAFCSTAVVDGVWYAAVATNANVLEEVTTAWTDDGNYVESRIITPWIKVAGVQGFQRVRRLQWLFERQTACDFKIEVAHDWDDGTWTTPVAWTSLASTDREREYHVARQKTEAIKVRVTDYTPTSGVIGTGRGLTHVALRARAGVKQGQGKLLPAAQKG